MRKAIGSATFVIAVIMLLSVFSLTAFATNGKTEVTGNIYEFDKDSRYEFNEENTPVMTNADNTYGTFYINGNISAASEKSEIPSYEIADGNLDLFYNYGDAMLSADADSWHLVEDKSKKIADMTLDSNIMKGTIILQTSKDRKNWTDVETIYNAFSNTPICTESIYTTTDVQLLNGCYYRIIVVYKLAIRTRDSNFLFVNTDRFDYKKCAEIYEFYAKASNGDGNAIDPNDGYRLGDTVRVEKHDGYFGTKEIVKGDLHYGNDGRWSLGNFFVSGYTDEIVESNGNVVFLKNVGDDVTLWFDLEQDIDALNENKKLSITADTNGHDQYFGTASMDFGRGTLIIRKTDHNNVQGEAQIYTNYLKANTSVDADTIVPVCEEGDYEVALDYEVTSDELIDKVGHYRIFFTFSVRNSNCMIYPFDIATGCELKNGSISDAGFRLDYANSLYLKVNIKRELLAKGADGLVEDTRFNQFTKDGTEYTDEGIYTITVKNAYNDETTVKKIYVGTNSILRAYMTTGLSIPEINDLVTEGATINEDGTILLAEIAPIEEPDEEPVSEATLAPKPSNDVTTDNNDSSQIEESKQNTFPTVVFIGVTICIIIVVVVVLALKKRKKQSTTSAESHEDEGGAK